MVQGQQDGPLRLYYFIASQTAQVAQPISTALAEEIGQFI